MVSRCGPPIWARRQQAAYLNKDCEHSESPKVRRRLPSPGEQRSECTADLNSCVRGREAAERGGPRGPREATRPALSRGAVASLPGLERRPPTSGRVEFCAGVGGTSPFSTPTSDPLRFPPRLMPHTLWKYFRNTGFYSLTVRGPLVVPRPPWTHAFLHAQARGEHVPHWVGDTELQGPVSSRLWRRTGKRQQLGAESPPPLSPAPPGAIDEVPTPSASEGDCIWM